MHQNTHKVPCGQGCDKYNSNAPEHFNIFRGTSGKIFASRGRLRPIDNFARETYQDIVPKIQHPTAVQMYTMRINNRRIVQLWFTLVVSSFIVYFLVWYWRPFAHILGTQSLKVAVPEQCRPEQCGAIIR